MSTANLRQQLHRANPGRPDPETAFWITAFGLAWILELGIAVTLLAVR